MTYGPSSWPHSSRDIPLLILHILAPTCHKWSKRYIFVDVCLFRAGVYLINWLLDLRHSGPLPPGLSDGQPLGTSSRYVPRKIFAALGRNYGLHLLPIILYCSHSHDIAILGDISSISLLGMHYVVLNSSKAVSAILEKQDIKCLDRPHQTMSFDLLGLVNQCPVLIAMIGSASIASSSTVPSEPVIALRYSTQSKMGRPAGSCAMCCRNLRV